MTAHSLACGEDGEIEKPGLYIYAVPLARYESGRTTTSLLLGYRVADNADEARGIAVTAAQDMMPDFLMGEILVTRVTDEDLISAQAAAHLTPSSQESISHEDR